ncbi:MULTISPECIES: SusC/RagA family TonB-linked outer membrane protein [Butyricimonas]|uniref:SusC/RagA family TonB-linked outer membrane protein n=1 Tax=Butyricimonas TaxID=574697 RepID=UPI0022DF17BC|nr:MULTISPECIES: SusC/RagA family TonB-linked outer membrane protein [Butyricimonas]
MKLVCFGILIGLMQVHATTYGQAENVSFEQKRMTIDQVFNTITLQLQYDIFYSDDELDIKQVVEIPALRANIEDVLKAVLGERFSYQFIGKTIIISPASADPQVNKKSVRLKGFVYDEKKIPMPGVTIQVVGTSVGTVSINNGWFAIDLPILKGKLKFSFVGYKDQEIEFTEKTDTLHIYMKEDVSNLDEVVVRAYGSQKKREVISAISRVTAEEMKELPTASLVNMLQGRMAGVMVVNQSGAPGSAQMVAIRGYNSLMTSGASDGQPLYVIDGVPMHSFVSPVSGTNTMADIDPAMIESVEVLKDAAAASIYGSRAGNGVILITTKKGRAGEAKFSANVSYSASQLMAYPEQVGGRMERIINLERLKNDRGAMYDYTTRKWSWPTSYEDVYEAFSGTYDGFWGNGHLQQKISDYLQDSLNPYFNNSTNWWKYVYKTGKILNANLQASGGSERMQYMVGAGYYEETGIAINSSYGRYNLSSNLTAKPTKGLDLNVRLYLAYTNKDRDTRNLMSHNRFEVITADPSSTSTLLSNSSEVEAEWLRNANAKKDKSDAYRAMGSVYLQYAFWKGFSLTGSASVDFSQSNSNIFSPSWLDASSWEENRSEGSISRSITVLGNVLLRYNKSFKEKHNLEVLLGMDINKEQYHYINGHGRGGPSDNIYYYNPNINQPIKNHGYGDYENWESMTSYYSDFREKTMLSYFTRVGYNYKQRYLVEGTLRRDGSSTFGEDHRWATFPSVAVGWAFSEEPFMRWASWLDWGKLRASYGTSGQIFTDEYLAHGLMSVDSDAFMENNGMIPNTMISPDLTWEKSEQYDIGLDLDMFDYRLKMKLDYYYKLTSSLIYNVELPGTILLAGARTENAMELSNEGIELELEADILRNHAVLWRTKFNISRNWNRFEKSYDGKDKDGLIIGRPTSGLMVYAEDGFYDSDDEVPINWKIDGSQEYLGTSVDPMTGTSGMVGRQKLLDLNGDGRIGTDDMYYVGTAQPLAYGGWVNELTWKNFSLNMLFNYALGRSMINMRPKSIYQTVINVNPTDMDFWEKPGDDADYPFFGYDFEMQTDKRVEKVHSVSLKQLTVGYDVAKKVSKKIGFSGIRFFVTMENLFYLSNYSGENPEVVDVYKGIDSGSAYPLPRKYSIGLTLNF